MKHIFKRIISSALCISLLGLAVPSVPVRADSNRIVTLGENISSEGRADVLKFFGLTESDLKSMEVITINNAQEHALLDDVLPKSVIGSKTYSCAYIQPTNSGGLNIKTANLTYVTSSSIYNSLQTAGIENGNIIVTAPFEVSGTGALTGIFKAYELDGSSLDDDKQALAAEELIVSSDAEEAYGKEAPKLISDLKDEVISGDAGSDLSEDELKKLVQEKAEERDVNLSDEDIQKISDLLSRLEQLDYDSEAFSDKLDDIQSAIENHSGETSSALNSFFEWIKNFFTNLFGQSSDSSSDTDSTESGTAESIFEDLDTSVFSLDSE